MTSADFDRALRRALSAGVTPGQAAELDRRLSERLAPRRRAVRGTHVSRLALGLTAAFVLLAGSAVAGATLFGQLVGGAPLLENVWDRATTIDESATDSGYTVVLEKAAVDRERVWLALSVRGADVLFVQVTDANGVVMRGGTAAGTGMVNGVSAQLAGLRVPDGVTPVGPYTAEITTLAVDGRVIHGNWTFTFDVSLTSPWTPSSRATGPR